VFRGAPTRIVVLLADAAPPESACVTEIVKRPGFE
jgi:hypothetical protein